MNTIDFGNMRVNQSYSKNYTIINNSSTNTSVANLGHSCSCVTTDVVQGGIIAPNGTAVIKVTAKPGSTGMYNKSFWFDFAGKHYNVTLKGYAS